MSSTIARPASLVAPEAARIAWLPGEREALASRPIGVALDLTIRAAADASGSPWQQLRVARYEQMAGRDQAAHDRVLGASRGSDDPLLQRWCRATLDLHLFWAGRPDEMDLRMPAEGDDSDTLSLYRLIAVALGRLSAVSTARKHTWAQQSHLLDRVAAGADAWLDANGGDATRLAAGVDVVLHAAALSFLSERAAWAVAALGRLRVGLRRHRLVAWLPIADFFAGYALMQSGELADARALVLRAIERLRRDPGSPWLPLALATECFLASYTMTEESVDLAPVERELVLGAWRSTRPLLAMTCIHNLAIALAARGDAHGARHLLQQLGPLETIPLVHEDRVQGLEVLFTAALLDAGGGASADVQSRLAQLERLMASPTRDAALARMRSSLGDGVRGLQSGPGPVESAAATGKAVEVLRARWLVLAQAITRGERSAALSELAALDAVATRARAAAIRVRAVQRFRAMAGAGAEPAALSGRPLEVAALAAAGLTNRRIAAELFLGVRTVEFYLAQALRSLGLTRRGQLTGLVFPAEVVPPGGRATFVSLTVRQGQVATLVAADCTNAEIADTLGIAEKTVEKHLAAIRERIGATTRTAIAAAFARG